MFRPEEADLYRDLRSKTKALIRKHVSLESLIQNLPAYKIDDKVVDRLEKEKIPEKAKVVNLYRSIVVHVQASAKREPHLFSIGDAAEEVIRRFQERQMESKEALKHLMDLAKKIAISEAERTQYNLSREEFSVFWSLRENRISNDIVGLSREVIKLLDSSKTWPVDRKKEMEVRKGVYKLLLKRAPQDKLAAIVNSLLEIHRRMIAA
jgi:type I restriction enzyme R subunit